MTTPTTTLSPELLERIDMLREHVEDNIDLWTTIGSFIDIDQLFDDETRGRFDDDGIARVMEESGYAALCGLFGLMAAAICERAGSITPTHVATLRQTNPEWFSEQVVGSHVAEALSRV